MESSKNKRLEDEEEVENESVLNATENESLNVNSSHGILMGSPIAKSPISANGDLIEFSPASEGRDVLPNCDLISFSPASEAVENSSVAVSTAPSRMHDSSRRVKIATKYRGQKHLLDVSLAALPKYEKEDEVPNLLDLSLSPPPECGLNSVIQDELNDLVMLELALAEKKKTSLIIIREKKSTLLQEVNQIHDTIEKLLIQFSSTPVEPRKKNPPSGLPSGPFAVKKKRKGLKSVGKKLLKRLQKK